MQKSQATQLSRAGEPGNSNDKLQASDAFQDLKTDLQMNDIRTNLRIMMIFIMGFILNKFLLRPYVLENHITGLIKTFTLSFPNLCEAVCGTIMLTNLALVGNVRLLKQPRRFKQSTIYFTATLFAAIYVILQELKVHNFGGRNVYDFNDVLFSIVGLGISLGYLVTKRPEYVD